MDAMTSVHAKFHFHLWSKWSRADDDDDDDVREEFTATMMVMIKFRGGKKLVAVGSCNRMQSDAEVRDKEIGKREEGKYWRERMCWVVFWQKL